jgi:hypothetical protein
MSQPAPGSAPSFVRGTRAHATELVASFVVGQQVDARPGPRKPAIATLRPRASGCLVLPRGRGVDRPARASRARRPAGSGEHQASSLACFDALHQPLERGPVEVCAGESAVVIVLGDQMPPDRGLVGEVAPSPQVNVSEGDVDPSVIEATPTGRFVRKGLKDLFGR